MIHKGEKIGTYWMIKNSFKLIEYYSISSASFIHQ